MSENKLNAKVRVYELSGFNCLFYKYKGQYYPITIVNEEYEEDGITVEVHNEPCAFKAAMVAQKQYAPLYSKQLKELGINKNKLVLKSTFTF